MSKAKTAGEKAATTAETALENSAAALKTGLEKALEELLAPRDPLADKAVIMEIRAGTGGDEAALFVADLYRMYSRYADGFKWRVEVMGESATELGGFHNGDDDSL